MSVVAYRRVSSVDQNLDRQLPDLAPDRTFEDKCSGATVNRPQWKACLDYMREGDFLHVHSLDRLARSTEDALSIIQGLVDKKIGFKSHKENLEFPSGGKLNPMQKMQLTMMSAIAEFERELIKERQREGIAAAKAKGKHLGRPTTYTADDLLKVEQLINKQGLSVSKACKEAGVPKASYYRIKASAKP